MERKAYEHLSAEERNVIHRQNNLGLSVRAIARTLNRAPSTIAREVWRNGGRASYDAAAAGRNAQARVRRGPRKLVWGSKLMDHVVEQLHGGWSPEQIAGRLRSMHPDAPEARVSHETIYCALYALPRGELRKALIGELRRAHRERLSRARGTDRRGTIPNMRSIRERPIEACGRLVPGHWEGDLIKGARNASAVGTLVERKSRYLILAKLTDASADATLHAFSRRFRHVPPQMRRTLTYDQGREMAHHERLARRLQIGVFFADPHSPWQRGTNENMNGFIREYLPKGADLSTLLTGLPECHCAGAE
jgi:IS30 family transposase